MINGFISSNRVADFISQLKLKIIQKLVPGLRKEGYSEEAERMSAHIGRPAPGPEPATNPPARPRPAMPPVPDDIPYGPRSHIPPDNPLEIGRRDLDPFGTFAPPPLFPPHGGDGMFVGPDHPIFGSRNEGWNGRRGPWGGDAFLPPLGAPPGARFDPIMPFNPRFGSRPPRRHTGEPDNDEFMPPGVVSADLFYLGQSTHFFLCRGTCSCEKQE